VTLETRCGNTAGFFLFILAKVSFAYSVSARKQAAFSWLKKCKALKNS
jgi:hypothetical protein